MSNSSINPASISDSGLQMAAQKSELLRTAAVVLFLIGLTVIFCVRYAVSGDSSLSSFFLALGVLGAFIIYEVLNGWHIRRALRRGRPARAYRLFYFSEWTATPSV